MILSACKKDEFQYSFETPSKLLVSIRENDQLITEFKYDNLNRLIQVDRYSSGDPVCISQFFEYNSQNNAAMSMPPCQYEFSYDYDNTGLPIKEYREKLQELSNSNIFEYEYIDKNE